MKPQPCSIIVGIKLFKATGIVIQIRIGNKNSNIMLPFIYYVNMRVAK